MQQSHLILGVLVAALLLSGCGGSSLGAVSLSKEGYLRQADLICRKADNDQPGEYEAFTAKHEKQLERLGKVRAEATISTDLKLPSARWQLRKIESLEVPRGEKRRIGSIIAGWRTLVREGARHPYEFGIWWNGRDPWIEMKKVALNYGFLDCEDLR